VLPAESPDLPLSTVGDLVNMLAESINLTRKGLLDPKVGNCLGYLASVLQRCLSEAEIERRLSELEQAVQTGKQKRTA